jgi:hypothetical protein
VAGEDGAVSGGEGEEEAGREAPAPAGEEEEEEGEEAGHKGVES